MSEILVNLTKAAAIIAAEIKTQADNQRVPKVSQALSIGTASKLPDNSYSIKITIDTSKSGAPAAGAYEWGSGERATVGPKDRIPIPEKPSGVKFPKEDWPQYDPNYYTPPRPAPNVFVFAQVKHPGVFPRPYIRPSINMHMQELINLLGQGAVVEITSKMKKVERIVVVI